MPYIGRAATNAGSVNYLDDISSGFDGNDVTFTCAVNSTTITPGQENVYIYLDGVFQHPGESYTISGSTITFTEAPVSGVDFTGYVAGEGAYLDDGTVSTAKLDDDAVTASKLDDDGTGFQVGDLGVGGSLTSGDKLTVTGRLRASGGIIGDLTGNVTGNLTGNVTGNLTGNVTGNTSGTAATVTGAAQSAITSVGTLTSLNTTGAVTATGSDYMLKAVSTSTSNSNAIRVSAESGVAQGKIEIGWHNDSSETGGGYGMLQVGKTANSPEVRIGASAVRIGASNGSQELKVNRSRMRHIDGLADASDFSHGDLYVNHISTGNIYMQRATTFANRLTLSGDGSGNGIFMGTGWQIFDNASESYGSTGSLVFFNGSARVEMRENGTLYMAGGLQSGSTLLGTVNISSTQYAVVGSNSSSRGIAICRDGSASFPDFRVEGNGNVTVNNSLVVNSSTTTAGITSSGTIFSSMSGTGSMANTAFRTLDGGSNDGVRIEHGGGDGRILFYSANSHRGTIDANKFTCHTNGQTLGTTANESVLFLQNNGNAARISTSKTFETYGGFYSHAATGGYDHGLTTHTNEFNPIVNWQSGYGRVHFSYRANNTYQDWTFYNGSSSGYTDLEAAAFNVTSDYRMKKTVTDFTTNVCDSIKDLRPVTYFWKANTKMHTTKQIGFLAHELQEKLPLSVKGEKDAVNEKGDIDPQTIKTEALATYIIKGMQEIIERLEALENN